MTQMLLRFAFDISDRSLDIGVGKICMTATGWHHSLALDDGSNERVDALLDPRRPSGFVARLRRQHLMAAGAVRRIDGLPVGSLRPARRDQGARNDGTTNRKSQDDSLLPVAA